MHSIDGEALDHCTPPHDFTSHLHAADDDTHGHVKPEWCVAGPNVE